MPVPVIIYTLEQYTAISEAIATGATKVQYGDKTVEYRSLNDMIRIQSLMYAQLFPCNKNDGRRYFGVSKGTTCSGRNRFNRD
jgi:hypothetical protein